MREAEPGPVCFFWGEGETVSPEAERRRVVQRADVFLVGRQEKMHEDGLVLGQVVLDDALTPLVAVDALAVPPRPHHSHATAHKGEG